MSSAAGKAIGIFDSGIGGISILKPLISELPNERFLYFADARNAPYGDQSDEFIEQRTLDIISWFVSKDVKAVVVACNTATTVAITKARKVFPSLEIFGVEPAIKPAAIQSKTKKVGVLATERTAKSSRLQELIDLHSGDSVVIVQSAPGLVRLIETGHKESDEINQLLRLYIEPMVAANIDTLVLGCTHYPFLDDQIRGIAGPSVQLLETGGPVAKHVKSVLEAKGFVKSSDSKFSLELLSNVSGEEQDTLVSGLLGRKERVTFLDI